MARHKESFMRISRLALVAMLLASALASAIQDQAAAQPIAASSQQGNGAAGQPGFTIRQMVRRVLVDIVVTDKDGNPVRGLAKNDFTVNEDGKTQKIISFDVENGSKPDFVPPKLPPLPANTFVNVPEVPERGPLYVILYDMVNIDPEDQATSRGPLLKFIDSTPPGTRFAIFVNATGLHLVQGFTSDRTLLHAAITSQGPGPHLPRMFLMGANYGKGDTGAAMSVFNFLAEYLEGMPGRKNLIWISDKFPLPFFATLDNQTDMDAELSKQTVAAMMRSQIAIYPLSARGVVVTEVHGSSPGGATGRSFSPIGGGPAPASLSQAAAASSAVGQAGYNVTVAENQAEDEIAADTGGHAYYSDNDLSGMIEKAVEHGESYYTVSYSPSNQKYNGASRHIEVKLAKKGYTLSYRTFYYALPEDAEQEMHKPGTPDARMAAAKVEDTLYANIEHGAPMLHDLLFRARVEAEGQPTLATAAEMQQLEDEPAFFRTRRKKQIPRPLTPIMLQKYRIAYGVIDLQLKALAASMGSPATLEFAAAVYDADGRMLNGILSNGQASSTVKPGGKDEGLFQAEQEINAPEGAAWIRIAVRDKLNNRAGTLEVPLPLKAEPVTQAANAAN
jgi:VWFA-related protein